ncbi:MAG: hypothetical protein R2789_16830 [Microthrixaceae bacterium]
MSSLRLVIEHPDDVWMAENFDAGGALYKAESTGDYSYRGDDPESYVDVFDQGGRQGQHRPHAVDRVPRLHQQQRRRHLRGRTR